MTESQGVLNRGLTGRYQSISFRTKLMDPGQSNFQMVYTLTAPCKTFLSRSWTLVHEYKEAHASGTCLPFRIATGSMGLTRRISMICQPIATLMWRGLESSTWNSDGDGPTTSRLWRQWPSLVIPSFSPAATQQLSLLLDHESAWMMPGISGNRQDGPQAGLFQETGKMGFRWAQDQRY